MAKDDIELREVLFEFQRHGNVVKVTAIDPVTNTEVSMVGHPRYGEALLKRIAIRKLIYVIAKNRRAAESGGR